MNLWIASTEREREGDDGDMDTGRAGPQRSSGLSDVLIARLEAAYVSVPVPLPELPLVLQEAGVFWRRVACPHLSLFTPDRIVDRAWSAGWRSAPAVVERLERAGELARGWSVQVERYTEVRVVHRDDRRSLIAMAVVRGLDALYVRVSEVVGVVLAALPAHVTVYTAPGGKGIGICDERELRSLSAPAPDRLAALIMNRLGATK